MAANKSIENFIFFENETISGKQKDYMVKSDGSEMMLKIVCTGSFQINVTADIFPKGETFKPYPCFQLPNMTMITDTITDQNYLYNISLSGIDYIRVEIISLTGSVSVYGKVVG